MVKLTHSSPLGELAVPNGEGGVVFVKPGDVVELPEAVAGRESGPWVDVDDEGNPLVPVDDGRAWRLKEDGSGWEARDLGAGLLALDDWRPADADGDNGEEG